MVEHFEDMNIKRGDDAVLQLPGKPLSGGNKKNIFLPISVTAALAPQKLPPFLGACRPFVGRCCYVCTPDSWRLFDEKVQSLRFHNTIHVTENSTRYRGWLVRRVCHLLFVWGLKIHPYTTGNISKHVLSTARVQNALSSGGPNSENCSISKVFTSQREAVVKILTQIKSSILPLVLRLISYMLLKFLRCLFLNVQVHLGQVDMARRAPQLYKAPVVYISVYKSCLDYLLLSFVLFFHGVKVPYFAVGDDIRSSIFRFILRKLGGIFLPKKCTDSTGRCTDPIVRAVLTSYVEKLLQDGQHLHIHLEDPCWDLNHLSSFGIDWLAVVVNAFISGQLSDLALVPVGISYSSTVDMLHQKYKENCSIYFWAVCCTVYQIFRHNFGCVRLDFGQPFSLKEYAKNQRLYLQLEGNLLEDLLLPAVLGKRSEMVDCEKNPRWIQSCISTLDVPDEVRSLVGSLSQHVLTTAVSCSAIMPTALLSCLLLYKHREGVFLPRLIKDFTWLLEEVLFRNFDVGFSGRLQDILFHTLSRLRDCIVLCRVPPNNVFVFPKNSREAVTDLTSYSQPVVSVFISEALGACAVNSVLMQMKGYAVNLEFDFDVVISQEELYQKTLQLFNLLPIDIFLMPCRLSYCFCQDALDRLVQVGILTMEVFDGSRPVCDTKKKQIPEELLWKPREDIMDSDSDCDEDLYKRLFKLSSSSSSLDYYCFLCNLLQPVLKAYAEAAAFLLDFDGPVEESAYTEDLYQHLLRKASETASYECATLSLATSAVQTFRELGVFHNCTSSMIQLSSTFSFVENRRKLHHFIRQFVI